MPRREAGGFTLTEILIVVAILAVLTAIAVPNFLAAKAASNETAAIATLRTLATAQAQVQGTGRIDADNDSIGEFGTFVELVGEAGIRTRRYASEPAAADFATQGRPLDPPALSPTLMDYMENSGYLVKGGYAFLIHLPDNGDPAGWVREEVRLARTGRGKNRRTVEVMSLRGGTQQIGIDLSESLWCAYAQPETLGRSGNRAFFTNQVGDVLQSSNRRAKHQGSTTAIPGRSAFLGAGITSSVAVGTRGNDRDVWTISN